MTLSSAVFLVLAGLVAGIFLRSAWIDITRMIIPNRMVLAMLWVDIAQIGLPYPFGWIGSPAGIAYTAAADIGMALLVFGILFVMWIPRWIGAGDVKLAGAASVWFGSAHALDFLSASASVGLLWGLGLVVIRQRPVLWLWVVQRAPWLVKGTKVYFPYGPALCAGALVALVLQFHDHGWIHWGFIGLD